MICKKCGMENRDGSSFCKECGTPLQTEEETDYLKEETISVWKYLGYQILFLIPVVGLVILLFLALGGTNNRNIRNFAAAYLCKIVILIIIVIIMFVAGIVYSNGIYIGKFLQAVFGCRNRVSGTVCNCLDETDQCYIMLSA